MEPLDEDFDEVSDDLRDAELILLLRAGREDAFADLVDRYYDTMLRVARMYVATKEAAEDVVQDTFLGIVQGIDRFEGRSSLRTWIFRILVNRARTRGEREHRTQPFSSFQSGAGDDGPSVDPDRFVHEGRWSGFWASPPPDRMLPEAQLLASEMGDRLMAAIAELPDVQRTVITLRDVRGLTSAEVCGLLDLTEGNQRVVLHRARTKIRTSLERYFSTSAGV